MNLFEKSMSLGLGLFVYSREKIEETVENLVSKGEVARKDAYQLTKELVKRGEEQREELNHLIGSKVEEVLNYMKVAKKTDIVSKDEIRQIVREEMLKVFAEQDFSKDKNES